ncbi:MAG: histidine kinase [Piscinibacter sp.]|nr:histidine kinase [Piscinibacter sp.]
MSASTPPASPQPPAPPPPPVPPAAPSPAAASNAWRDFGAALLRAFHAYGSWLVSISWKRFFLLALLLMIISGIAQNVPPFNWPAPSLRMVEIDTVPTPPTPPAAPKAPKAPVIQIEKPDTAASGARDGVEITIGKQGIRIRPTPAAEAASATGVDVKPDGIEIKVPPGADSDEVREAIREARDEIKAAIEEARAAAAEAVAEEARKEHDVTVRVNASRRPRVVHVGDALPELALLWIAMSAILKITYKGRLQAEVKAAQATETAEAESLKRQVVEARMAAMQAQVEPHFLFNTLASIDHLIETDPPRASAMQKNLIALLRASMPTMREANAAANGVRDLGREMAVITPYLEILKVRMEDRLQTVIDVPEGLRSAEFPPMMIQSLVENAIKHGLEPKPEGGTLTVKAEIVHGKLAVSVSDTGVGFGKAATAGTGIGLNNIRERLALLYGRKATLTVTENAPQGTRVTITVPYVAQNGDAATMSA